MRTKATRPVLRRTLPAAMILGSLGVFFATGLQAVTYHFDNVVVAQTVCTATTATTITTATLSGTQVTLQPTVSGAGDFHLRMDASGLTPTYAQMMYTPAFGSCAVIAANATFTLYARASWTGTTPQWQIRLYDHDPSLACAAGTLIGQSAWTNNVGATGTYANNNVTIANAAYSIAVGHRVRFEVWLRGYAGTTGARVRYGQTGTDCFLTTSESGCSANNTTAGLVTAVASTTSCTAIDVSAPYTNDGNTNNTLSYRYRTPSGSGAWVGPTSLAHSASPYSFSITGLTQGATYDVEVTYVDADGVSGTATQTVSNIAVGPNCTLAGTATATVDSCTQITVSGPFTQNSNADGSTTYERGPAAVGPWTAACSGVTGASPRACVDTGVLSSSTYYYRTTYSDPDGVGGTAQQVIGPFTTPGCSVNPVTPGVPSAVVDSCTQITVSSPFTGDSNSNSATLVEYNTSNSWPGTTACAALTGASPRSCPVGGLATATAYWFRVTFSDVDGVSGSNPQVIGPFSTLDCRTTAGAATATVDLCTQITVSAPWSGDNNGNGRTTFERGPAVAGPWTTVCSNLAGASPRSCIDTGVTASSSWYYRVTVSDADGVAGTNPQVIGPFSTPACVVNATTVTGSSALATSCKQITVTATFTGDGDRDGQTLVEYNTSNSWPGTTACAAVVGSPPRSCSVTGLAASTAYWIRVTFSDPDGVAGTNPTVIGPITTAACGADQVGPTLLFLSPARDAILGGTDRAKVQVFDQGGLAGANPVQWSIDGGALSSVVAVNVSYNCDAPSLPGKCSVYEFDLATGALANGFHYVSVRATDAASNVANISQPFQVMNTGGSAVGAGTILRRTTGSQLCLDCHNLQTHSSQYTSTSYGNWAIDCLTCHTPHKTTNIHLIRNTLATPSSGNATVVFRVDDKAGGTNPQLSYLGDFSGAGNTPYNDGICETCHTKTNHYRNDSSGGDHSHNAATRCINCHKHDRGFAKAESDGDDDCLSCHTFGMVLSEPTRTNTYHHVLEAANKVTAGLTVYPTAATPTVATADQDKTCVQCHADHNVFRPDINLSNTLGRGANLRSRIANAPPAVAKGVNPAAAPGDVATGYYWNRDADATFTAGGVCLSCHTNAQTKNVTDQKTYAGDPGQTTAIVPVAADFYASAHSFTVGGQITTGSSAFTIACTKCHSTSSTNYQDGTWKFQLHTSDNRRLLNPLGITAPADPLEENFCFRCHSRTTDTTPGGGPVKATASRDYFNQAAMSNQAELLFNEFSNAASYPWDHPVQGSGGLHDAVEGLAANDGTIGGAQRHVQCEDCHNPHAAAPIASGNFAGSVSVYATNAAPAMDVLTDGSKAWAANSLAGYTVKITTGAQAGKYSTIYSNGATTLSVEFATAPLAGVQYIIVNSGVRNNGNQVSPAQRDVWGVAPTWPAPPAPPNWNDTSTATAADITTQYTAVATWNRTTSATIQGQICIKCHSAYAYGAAPPNTPGGAGNSTTAAWVNTAGAATAQSDIANQFNPNNLGHHAIFARGKNQPLVSSDVTTSTYNPNWPKSTTGTLTATNGSTAVTLTGGTFPSTALPGWSLYIGNTAPAQGIAGWYEIASIVSGTSLTLDRTYTGATGGGKAYMLTAGLGNNFVPPWGPWSTLSCSDCHTSSVASDPFGPHASANKWLLRGAETQVFDFYNGTSVATITNTASDAYNVCVNCHRRDVYGDYNFTTPGGANFARQTHPVDNDHGHQERPKWGIVCLNCHGGARIGTIHGTSLGRGANGAAGSYSGKRLLAGASWYGVTRGTTTATGTCWTKAAADSVNNCSRAHTNQSFSSGNANYNYDSNP